MKKFWTKTGKLFSLLLAATTAFTACTDDNEDFRQSANKALDIQVAVKPTSRAMVMGTALPEGAQIGVNVTATDGSEYDGQNAGYLNVPYTATGTGTSQTWGSTAPVMLSGTEGLMYAYFPYTQGIDYTAVAVDIADQHDWMVGAEAYAVNDKASSVAITMNHAQTALNINVVRDAAYTGEGLVEALAITSEGLASEGTLDTRDGSWSAQAGANTAISIISAPFTLDGSTLTNQENPYMFVPASDETKDFTVTATVDGKAYNVGVAMNEAFAPGKMYQLNVKVTNTGLVVSKVSLVDWTTELLPDAEFEPVKDNTVSYDNYITIVYQVTEESLDIPHSIFRFEYEGSEYNTDLTLIQDFKIDGKSVEPVYEYKFENTGEHIVQVLLKNNTEIPENFIFAIYTPGSKLYIPNSVQNIGGGAFAYCTGLTSISIPNSVTEIGDWAFEGCTGIRHLTIGSGVTTIGEGAFYNCAALFDITSLATNAPAIQNNTFEEVRLRGTLYINNGAVGYNSWMDTGNYYLGKYQWVIYEMTTGQNGVSINSAGKANGIYAISASGELIDYTAADASAIGVALITDKQRIMIEKNGEANTISQNAAAYADNSSANSENHFLWSQDYYDNPNIMNYLTVDGAKNEGILPKAEGVPDWGYDDEPDLSTDCSTWTAGALSDFNGKSNTEAHTSYPYAIYGLTEPGMNTYCIKFNKTDKENRGYSDWYVPALGQLAQIYLNVTEINEALTAIGGTVFDLEDIYWSSTEQDSSSAWRIAFYYGGVDAVAGNRASKFFPHKVRFIRDLQ